MSMFTYEVVGDVAILTLQMPRMGAATAVRFRDEVVAMLQKEGVKRILLDLASVEIIDSSGLGVIVSVMKTVGGVDNLILCDIRPAVLSVFKLTRMDRVFRIRDSVVQAKHDLGLTAD